jgi:hypothetical protein
VTIANDESKPATAARIYDYFLGGTHNYPADRQAAQALIAATPMIPAIARTNRAFLRRAVRFMAANGVRQFLDIGSGIPTVGNVHDEAAEARVVYVDIDPVAVAESLEILEGNHRATALRADLRDSASILDHPDVRRLVDFEEPVGVLLAAVLHFVPDEHAYPAVERLVASMAPGSYLCISHGTLGEQSDEMGDLKASESVWKGRTATPISPRSSAAIERFFGGLELVEPGLVWVNLWRPGPGDPTTFAENPAHAGILAGVARR